jgi:hypothetical protein
MPGSLVPAPTARAVMLGRGASRPDLMLVAILTAGMGSTPHCGGKDSTIIVSCMRPNQRPAPTLGNFITAAYDHWGSDSAPKMVRLLAAARLVVLRAPHHLLITAAKARSA